MCFSDEKYPNNQDNQMKTNTKLPRLFSRRSDGGLQLWEVEVEGSKYRVTSGMVDGKAHTNEWTQCVGKNTGRANETSPEQQAQLEAAALWKKKHDSGYRENPDEVDSTGIFEPMLAKKFEDYEADLKYPVWSQPKLDGIRCIARKDGTWTRNGKRHTTLRHVEAALAKVFEKYPDLVIDGEAYADKLNKDFSRLCSLIKRPKPTESELKECEAHIRYHVYDCRFPDRPDMSFAQRITKLYEILNGVPYVEKVPTEIVDSRAQLDTLYETYMAEGQEGQIVRTNTAYENKRSSSLLKRKEFDDNEFTILGMEEGTGNRAGTCGAMMFQTPEGKAFKSNVKGSWEFVHEVWQNRKKYMGRQATIRYFGLTPGDKIPRFPYVVGIRDGE